MATNNASTAAEKIEAASAATTRVTTPQLPGEAADLEPVTFDRLSLERRVLAFITSGESPPMGSRNTLAALTYDLMRDPNTTNPPPPNDRLDTSGSVADVAQRILDCLDKLEDAGLVKQNKDDSYHVTAAGRSELDR